MTATPSLAPKLRFPNLLQFAALICIAGCSLPFAARGQNAADTAPDTQATPTPAPASFQNPIPVDQLSFLNDYAGHPAKEAMKDKRFSKLLKMVIPRSEYHYGRDMPLSEAADAVMEGRPPMAAIVALSRFLDLNHFRAQLRQD